MNGMRKLFGGVLATGAAMLAVGMLGSQKPRRRHAKPAASESNQAPYPAPAAPITMRRPQYLAAVTTFPPKPETERKFSIKRMKSDVGSVYWMLEGFGKYKCFVLCDSWEEAMQLANAKLEEVDAIEARRRSVSAIA